MLESEKHELKIYLSCLLSSILVVLSISIGIIAVWVLDLGYIYILIFPASYFLGVLVAWKSVSILIEDKPDQESLLELAESLVKQGRENEAIGVLQKAIDASGKDNDLRAAALLKLGVIYSRRGLYDKAETTLYQAIDASERDDIKTKARLELRNIYKKRDMKDKFNEMGNEIAHLIIPSGYKRIALLLDTSSSMEGSKLDNWLFAIPCG